MKQQQYSRPSRTLTLNTHGGTSHLRIEQIVAVRATDDMVDVFTQLHIFTVDCSDEDAAMTLASDIHDLMAQ